MLRCDLWVDGAKVDLLRRDVRNFKQLGDLGQTRAVRDKSVGSLYLSDNSLLDVTLKEHGGVAVHTHF